MKKLREILEKLSYTRNTNIDSADKQVDQAEKQILETHIPKSQLPSESEIEILIHAPNKEKIDLYLAKSIAKAIRERLDA